jgi:hypothetical protein
MNWIALTTLSLVAGCTVQGGFSGLGFGRSGASGGSPPPVASGGAVASGGTAPSAASGLGGGDRAEVWRRFAIKGVELGTELARLTGFVCDKNVGGYRHGCVKFLDARCASRKIVVGDAPAGQACSVNSSGSALLDGQAAHPPLSFVLVIGTDTQSPKAYEIQFLFAADMLTEDSKAGAALIARYGKPTTAQPPTQMGWHTSWSSSNDLHLEAGCELREEYNPVCRLSAYDGDLLTVERSIQQAADTERAKQRAPDAPSF